MIDTPAPDRAAPSGRQLAEGVGFCSIAAQSRNESMATENQALAILETPYRTYGGRLTPAQPAGVVDPRGVLRDLAAWMGRLADGLEAHPEAVVHGAVATLRRGASSYVPLLSA